MSLLDLISPRRRRFCRTCGSTSPRRGCASCHPAGERWPPPLWIVRPYRDPRVTNHDFDHDRRCRVCRIEEDTARAARKPTPCIPVPPTKKRTLMWQHTYIHFPIRR